MPLVRIEIMGGKSPEYKKDLLSAVRGAMKSSLGVPDQSLQLRLFELAPDCLDLDSSKTDKWCLIEVSMFPGRGREPKGKMISALAGALKDNLGVPPTDISVLVNDPPFENWGPGGVQREG